VLFESQQKASVTTAWIKPDFRVSPRRDALADLKQLLEYKETTADRVTRETLLFSNAICQRLLID
jgi:hypothetical protein